MCLIPNIFLINSFINVMVIEFFYALTDNHRLMSVVNY